MITDFMFDIESLDTKPSCVVLSIGLTGFNVKDSHSGIPLAEYFPMGTKDYRDEQIMLGRTVSKDTVEWWKQQSKQAQRVFKVSSGRKIPDMLTQIADLITGDNVCKDPNIWGNGPDLDNAAIASLFELYDITVPWKFYQNRDYRTINKEHGHIAKRIPHNGTKHNALDDAIRQTHQLHEIYRALQAAKIPTYKGK